MRCVALLSPELADTTDPDCEDFRAGNILEQSLQHILRGAHRLRYVSPKRSWTTPACK